MDKQKAGVPMSSSREEPTEIGDVLPASHRSDDFAKALRQRRSTLADQLGEPGPAPEVLDRLLAIAARVPDHRRVVPFRFLRIAGRAREQLGARLAEIYAAKNGDARPAQIERERNRFARAPVVICVVARLDADHKTPVWEQTLTCGAVCHNLLLAASAHGFAAQWITEWYAYDADVLSWLGLEAQEQVAGFVYIGTAQAPPKERPRPDAAELTTDFTPPPAPA